MPYSVTSWFVQQAAAIAPNVVRQFTIGGSDYSRWVTRWPSVQRSWNDIRPISLTIGLANEDQTFNLFKTDKTKLRASCALKLGFTHPTSGNEYITMFAGTVERVQFSDGLCELSMGDKLKQLSERVVGASNSPVFFSSSGTLPSDIAWTLVTCYGGFSSLSSTNNPDINYADFKAWAAVFSGDNVQMRGRFEGKKVLECLRSLGRHTQSAIFMKENKLSFNRFTTISTDTTSLAPNNILSTRLSIDDTDIVNKQWVYADFKVESDFWTIATFDVLSASVNSFGLRELVEKDESVWYTSSATALNLAQRMTRVAGVPYDRLSIDTTLVPLHRHVGEIIQAEDAHLGITEGWRIMEQRVDMETGKIGLTIDASQVNTPFLLDVSSLDGPDLLL
jgi:hypothetical protein